MDTNQQWTREVTVWCQTWCCYSAPPSRERALRMRLELLLHRWSIRKRWHLRTSLQVCGSPGPHPFHIHTGLTSWQMACWEFLDFLNLWQFFMLFMCIINYFAVPLWNELGLGVNCFLKYSLCSPNKTIPGNHGKNGQAIHSPKLFLKIQPQFLFAFIASQRWMSWAQMSTGLNQTSLAFDFYSLLTKIKTFEITFFIF